MKKVRMMLMVIGLIAVTGGLFAFKTIFTPTPFCTTDAIQAPNSFYTCRDTSGIPLTCEDLTITAIVATTTNNESNGNVFCTTVAVVRTIEGIPTFTCDGRNCVDEAFQAVIEE